MTKITDIKTIMMGFVMILVGVVLIGIVGNETTRITQANTVTNEQITIVNQTAVSLANSQLDSFTSLINATNATDTLAVNTDFTVDLSGGSVTSLSRGGLFNATYAYREVGDSTSRTLVNLVLVFFAIGILGLGAGVAIKGLRDAGILNF